VRISQIPQPCALRQAHHRNQARGTGRALGVAVGAMAHAPRLALPGLNGVLSLLARK